MRLTRWNGSKATPRSLPCWISTCLRSTESRWLHGSKKSHRKRRSCSLPHIRSTHSTHTRSILQGICSSPYRRKSWRRRSLMSAALRMLPAPRISGSRPSASLTSTWTGNRWDSNLQKRKRSLPFLWISRVPAQPAPSCSPPFGKTGHMTARCKNRLTYTFVLCGRRFVNTGFRKLWRWKKEYSA